MRDVMNREQVCEYLGLEEADFETLFPAPPVFQLAGRERYRREDLLEWLDEVVQSQYQARERLAAERFRLAQKHVIAKEYEHAAPILKDAIGLNRRDPNFHFNYGFCLYHLGRFEESDTEFRKALEIDPKGEWRDAAKYHIGEIEKMKIAAMEKAQAGSTAGESGEQAQGTPA